MYTLNVYTVYADMASHMIIVFHESILRVVTTDTPVDVVTEVKTHYSSSGCEPMVHTFYNLGDFTDRLVMDLRYKRFTGVTTQFHAPDVWEVNVTDTTNITMQEWFHGSFSDFVHKKIECYLEDADQTWLDRFKARMATGFPNNFNVSAYIKHKLQEPIPDTEDSIAARYEQMLAMRKAVEPGSNTCHVTSTVSSRLPSYNLLALQHVMGDYGFFILDDKTLVAIMVTLSTMTLMTPTVVLPIDFPFKQLPHHGGWAIGKSCLTFDELGGLLLRTGLYDAVYGNDNIPAVTKLVLSERNKEYERTNFHAETGHLISILGHKYCFATPYDEMTTSTELTAFDPHGIENICKSTQVAQRTTRTQLPEQTNNNVYMQYLNKITGAKCLLQLHIQYLSEYELIHTATFETTRGAELYERLSAQSDDPQFITDLKLILQLLEGVTSEVPNELTNADAKHEGRQKVLTREYVKQYKDDHIEQLASQVIDQVKSYLTRYMPVEEINHNNIGRDLSDIGVKKIRKAKGNYYGMRPPGPELAAMPDMRIPFCEPVVGKKSNNYQLRSDPPVPTMSTNKFVFNCSSLMDEKQWASTQAEFKQMEKGHS